LAGRKAKLHLVHHKRRQIPQIVYLILPNKELIFNDKNSSHLPTSSFLHKARSGTKVQRVEGFHNRTSVQAIAVTGEAVMPSPRPKVRTSPCDAQTSGNPFRNQSTGKDLIFLEANDATGHPHADWNRSDS